MPLFEYTCGTCCEEFEALVRDDEKPHCPGCGSKKVEKQISVPAMSRASSQLTLCGSSEPNACGMGPCGTDGCPFE
jgi:putative FmdB family regulatory protein